MTESVARESARLGDVRLTVTGLDSIRLEFGRPPAASRPVIISGAGYCGEINLRKEGPGWRRAFSLIFRTEPFKRQKLPYPTLKARKMLEAWALETVETWASNGGYNPAMRAYIEDLVQAKKEELGKTLVRVASLETEIAILEAELGPSPIGEPICGHPLQSQLR